MAHTADMSRYHPAVLSFAALATACGIYAVYNSYTAKPTTTLRRSNAVHRPRQQSPMAEPPTTTIERTLARDAPPLGNVTIMQNRGSVTPLYRIHLANWLSPDSESERLMLTEALEHISSQPQEVRKAFGNAILVVVLEALFMAAERPREDAWVQLESLGFPQLLATIAGRDTDGVRLYAQEIAGAFSLGHDVMSPEQIDIALMNFLWSDQYQSPASDSDADLAETEEPDMLNVANQEPSQGLRGLLYHIAEENAKRNAFEHRGIHCESCNEFPIRGTRWHCLNCPDYDLCSTCEATTTHQKTHVFAKIKVPIPVLSQPTQEHEIWYPGDPRKIHPPLLDAKIKKILCQRLEMEEPQMDALYEQFQCLANVPWHCEETGVDAAIDRRAFNKALTCNKWPQRFSANAMHDRMFAFYDTDGSGTIDFREFVDGMAYLRGSKRFASLKRAIRGYDMDGDGYVDRKDFLRLLRAKFDIQKQIVSDAVDAQGKETTYGAMETLRGSQPISSVFSAEDIPPGETRTPRGKQADAFGDLQPFEGTRAILNDEDAWTLESIGAVGQLPAHEQLSHHLSHFEELLYSPHADPAAINQLLDGASGETVFAVSCAYGPDPIHTNTSAPHQNSGADEAHVEDIVWQVTEAGFNQLLDKIFLPRERQDIEAQMTQAEREKWREQIEVLEFRDSSFSSGVQSLPESGQSASISLADGIVPTDWESLERREKEIPEAPLIQLLHTSGYGVRDDTDDAEVLRAPSSSSSDIQQAHHSVRNHRTHFGVSGPSPLRNVVSHDDLEDTGDPTLPHNRPDAREELEIDAVEPSKAFIGVADSHERAGSDDPEQPPSKARLQHLADLDQVQEDMNRRGGFGRLSYIEIENAATNAPSGEVRNLIKSWLEWAAF